MFINLSRFFGFICESMPNESNEHQTNYRSPQMGFGRLIHQKTNFSTTVNEHISNKFLTQSQIYTSV